MLDLLSKYVKWNYLVVIIGLGLGLYFFTFQILGFDLAYFPGNLGDGRLNLYFLEHSHKFFCGNIESYWDVPFMYPEKNILAYSDNLIGSAPIYSFFRLIGLETFASYQWWFIVVSSLNYFCSFLLLKHLFKNNSAAVLGAFVFAFSLAIQSQLAHAQTFPRFVIPLALLFAAKFYTSPKPKFLFLSILLFVYQIYCGIYLGFMLFIPLSIFLLFGLLKGIFEDRKEILNLKWFLQSGVAVVVNVLLLLPLMLPYLERKKDSDLAYFQKISNSIPTLKSYFFSHSGSIIWDFLDSTCSAYPNFWNHQIFTGGIATLAFILVLIYLIENLVRFKFRLFKLPVHLVLFLAGIITFIFYLRFGETTAYIAIYYIPGFSAIRSISRIINIELIFFGLATALIFFLVFKKDRKLNPIIFCVAISLIVIDNFHFEDSIYRTEVSKSIERTNKIDNYFATIPAGETVSYEPAVLEGPSAHYQLDAMLMSQKHNLNSINGYTADSPVNFHQFWRNPNKESRNIWLKQNKMKNETVYVVNGESVIDKVIYNYEETSE